MIPPLIVHQARQSGLNLIAITDHNASENVPAVIAAAQGEDLTVLPGMELQTEEEIHSICLFDTIEQLQTLQEVVDHTLPDVPNNVEFFGEQFIVDETGDFIRRKKELLINSTHLSLEEAYKIVTDLGGLFIPAHVNREAFGLFYHLGFIPADLDLHAIEITRHITPEKALETYPQLVNYHLIQSGDVHFLSDFLGINQFFIKEPTISELIKALHGIEGRWHKLQPPLDNTLS